MQEFKSYRNSRSPVKGFDKTRSKSPVRGFDEDEDNLIYIRISDQIFPVDIAKIVPLKFVKHLYDETQETGVSTSEERPLVLDGFKHLIYYWKEHSDSTEEENILTSKRFEIILQFLDLYNGKEKDYNEKIFSNGYFNKNFNFVNESFSQYFGENSRYFTRIEEYIEENDYQEEYKIILSSIGNLDQYFDVLLENVSKQLDGKKLEKDELLKVIEQEKDNLEQEGFYQLLNYFSFLRLFDYLQFDVLLKLFSIIGAIFIKREVKFINDNSY